MATRRRSTIESEGMIRVIGAREHNLKNISVAIPRERFVVVTGVSGSGKSTLAFDLLFAEGQRRFLDSMNAYARQFVEQMARPDVDLVTGLPPTVSIEQRTSRGGGKSTVATVTEVQHFLRLLFARLGRTWCPECDVEVAAQTQDQVLATLRREQRRRGRLLLLAPVVRNRKGFHSDVAAWAARHGYGEVRADGKLYSTSGAFRLDRFREHTVEIVVGPLGARSRGRGAPAKVDEALRVGGGRLLALDPSGRATVHSTDRSCPGCARSFEVLDPRDFSYNSPRGWCVRCRGFGELFYLPEVDRGARAEAIEESWYEWQEGKREICPECQGSRLNPAARAVRLVLPGLRLEGSAGREAAGPQGRGVTMLDLAAASVDQLRLAFGEVQASGRTGAVLRDVLPEIRERLRFLQEVGLGYLQMGRSVTTLSGGESQRIRLAAQLGSNLSGVLYVLDEPTIGLHARDNAQLLRTLERLRQRGNSLVVVEHDDQTMREADFILDLGPGAGARGGEVVACGTLAELMRHPESVTGQCLRQPRSGPEQAWRRRPVGKGREVVKAARHLTSRSNAKGAGGGVGVTAMEIHELPPTAAGGSGGWLRLAGAREHNLKNLTVDFPLGRFVTVTGVSGSGKSTLVRSCLLTALRHWFEKKETRCGSLEIQGAEALRGVCEVDQSPIGRTPRSIPATYVGFFDEIRQLFAQVPEARWRGFGPGRFSFNSAQGRCPECDGAGVIKLEMNFLPPAFVKCETCGGSRYDPETLDILLQGRNIAQVLDLTVAEALEAFSAFGKVRRPLEALRDTGLDYLHLGQTSPTLSGGEAQRVKLVTHLLAGLTETGREPRRGAGGHNLFVLEEPTIGLHMSDVHRLVEVIQRLVDAGHTVLVIEHNLDLIAACDWVVDLGPEAGAEGGRVVAVGPPEEIARCAGSHTGRYLRARLRAG